MEDLYTRNEDLIAKKNLQIAQLESQIFTYQRSSIPFEGLNKEIFIQYPNVTRMAYAVSIEMNGAKIDTIPTFLLRWKANQGVKHKNREKEVLQAWLKQRLDLETVRIVEY